MVALGIYAGNVISQSNQWSGADRTLGVWGLACIYAAFQIGGAAIVGAAQDGYNFGLAAMWYSLGTGSYFIVDALFAGGLRAKMTGDSVPAFLRQHFNKGLSRFYAVMFLLMMLFLIPLQSKSVASLIQVVIPELDVRICLVVSITLAAVYTGYAGMKGAEVIGKIVCFFTYLLLIAFVIMHLNKFGGYSGLVASLPEGHGKIFAGRMTPAYVGALILGGVLSSSLSQVVLQPLLAARSDGVARAGALLGYVISAPICIITGIIGMMAAKHSNFSLGNGVGAFAWITKELSHPAVAGLFFAVTTMIIAATMATFIMSAGTVVKGLYFDLINPKATDKQLLAVSRWGTILAAYITLIPAILLPSSAINALFMTVRYACGSPFSFAIIGGTFWSRVTTKAASWSVIASTIVVAVWLVMGLDGRISVLYPSLVVSFAVGIAATLMDSGKAKS
jgi:Na+/proline symporter